MSELIMEIVRQYWPFICGALFIMGSLMCSLLVLAALHNGANGGQSVDESELGR